MAGKKEKVKTTKKTTKKKATKEEVIDEFLSEAVGLTVTDEVMAESDRTVEEYREKMAVKKAEIEEVQSIEDFVSNAFDTESKTDEDAPEQENGKLEEKVEPVVEETLSDNVLKPGQDRGFEVTVESLRAKIEKPSTSRKTSKQVYGYNCMGIIYDD